MRSKSFLDSMAVVLVRAQDNLLAIWESGNIFLKSLVAWSLDKKGMLCFATNVAHLTSDSIPWSLVWDWNKEVIWVVYCTAFDISLCLLPLRWEVTSWRPPWVIPKSIAHRVHQAYKLPRHNCKRRGLTKCLYILYNPCFFLFNTFWALAYFFNPFIVKVAFSLFALAAVGRVRVRDTHAHTWSGRG